MNKIMLCAVAAAVFATGVMFAYDDHVANLTPFVVEVHPKLIGKVGKTVWNLNPGQIVKHSIGGYLQKGWYVKVTGPSAFIEKSIGFDAKMRGQALAVVAYPVIGDTGILGGTFTSKAPTSYKIYGVTGWNRPVFLLGELKAQ